MFSALLLALLATTALGQQQQAFDAMGRPAPPSLTKLALDVFDADKNGAVTLKEVSAAVAPHTGLLWSSHVPLLPW